MEIKLKYGKLTKKGINKDFSYQSFKGFCLKESIYGFSPAK